MAALDTVGVKVLSIFTNEVAAEVFFHSAYAGMAEVEANATTPVIRLGPVGLQPCLHDGWDASLLRAAVTVQG